MFNHPKNNVESEYPKDKNLSMWESFKAYFKPNKPEKTEKENLMFWKDLNEYTEKQF